MRWIVIIGILASSFSLLRLFVAFPEQIWKNKKLRSCEGLAPTMVYSTFVGYILWTLYGWTKPDLPIAISSSIGTILSGIITAQFIYYRAKTKIREGDKR